MNIPVQQPYKSPFDSTEIRQGLMNIKQSQMELLRELKNENHILKKYSPPDDPINEEDAPTHKDSALYQFNVQSESLKENIIREADDAFVNFHPKDAYKANSALQFQQQVGSIVRQTNAYSEYAISHPKNIQGADHRLICLQPGRKGDAELQKELQKMGEELHWTKRNLFNVKQRNKDMALHMEFSASLHNLILKEVLQPPYSLQNIKAKVREEVKSYQQQFPDYKSHGIEQAFNIINLQSDSVHPNEIPVKHSGKRTPIFPPRSNSSSSNGLGDNLQILKQMNELKDQIKELTLDRERKLEQISMSKGQFDYTVSLLNKELQVKNAKFSEYTSEIHELKQKNKFLKEDNGDLKSNVDRLRSELQRHINKIQSLEGMQVRTNETISKEQRYMKFLKEQQQKSALLEGENRQKAKLIEIHHVNINKLSENNRDLQSEVGKLKLDKEDLASQLSIKKEKYQKCQDKLDRLEAAHAEESRASRQRHEAEIVSLNSHISELKRNFELLLKQEESHKESLRGFQEIKTMQVEKIKFTKTIDHLWKIKEVEYDNVNSIVRKLLDVKAELRDRTNKSHPQEPKRVDITQQRENLHSNGTRRANPAKSKSKSRSKQQTLKH